MFRLINKSGLFLNNVLSTTKYNNINSTTSIISISTTTTTTTTSNILSYSSTNKNKKGGNINYVAPLKSSRKEKSSNTGGGNRSNYIKVKEELKQKSSSKSTSLYGGSGKNNNSGLSSTNNFKTSNSITRSGVNSFHQNSSSWLKSKQLSTQEIKKKRLLQEKRDILFEKKDNNVVFEQLDQDTLHIQNKSKYADNLNPTLKGTGIAFSRLGIQKNLVESIKNQFNITIPSIIQQLAIPEILSNSKDVLFVSQTGTGKTLTYLLPIIQHIKKIEQQELKELKDNNQELKKEEQEKEQEEEEEDDNQEEEEVNEEEDNNEILNNDEKLKTKEEKIEFELLLKRLPRRPKAIILVPTRELALQVMGVAKKISHDIRFSCTAISSGGGDINKYVKTFKKLPIDILISTPGLLIKLIERKKIFFSKLRHIVIDEADSMFTIGKGFDVEIDKIVEPFKYRLQNKSEQGLTPVNAIICSATLTEQLMKTINQSFPTIEKLSTPTIHKSLNTLEQRFINIQSGDKHQALLDSIKSVNLIDKVVANENSDNQQEQQQQQQPIQISKKKTLIFCNKPNSCRSTEYFLSENGFNVTSLHGEMPPHRRSSNWKSFLKGDKDYLVATDIASRGIDIAVVDHVILFDFPSNPIDYLHRIGRTARAGNKGLVTNLITKRDKVLADSIKESIRKGYSLENLSSNKRKL